MSRVKTRFRRKEVQNQKDKLSNDSDFIYANKIEQDGIAGRIMPTHENVGNLFLEVVQIWVQNKPYLCPSTLGGISVMEDEKDKILAEMEEKGEFDRLDEINAILADTNYKTQKYKKQSSAWFNFLEFDFKPDEPIRGLWVTDVNTGKPLTEEDADFYRTGFLKAKRVAERKNKDVKDYTFTMADYLADEGVLEVDENDKPIVPKGVELGEYEPIDLNKLRASIKSGKAKILVTNPNHGGTILSALDSKLCISDDGEDNLVVEPEFGANIDLKKTKEGKKTVYTANLHSQRMEMPVDLYDTEKIPDLVKLVKGMLKPEKELRQIMRAFMYGEEMPETDSNSDEDKKAKRPAANTRKRRKIVDATEDESKSSLVDDAMDLDD